MEGVYIEYSCTVPNIYKYEKYLTKQGGTFEDRESVIKYAN